MHMRPTTPLNRQISKDQVKKVSMYSLIANQQDKLRQPMITLAQSKTEGGRLTDQGNATERLIQSISIVARLNLSFTLMAFVRVSDVCCLRPRSLNS